ncbi:MAG: hypothetical protein AB7T49_15715 [Oligoflexales bacterium]
MANQSVSIEEVQHFIAEKKPVFFSTDKVPILFQTKIVWADASSIVLANTISPEHITQVVNSGQFFLQLEMTRFSSSKISTDGVHVIFPWTSLQPIQESRKEIREIFKEETAVVEFVNPADKTTKLSKSILDMSSTGLSMRVPQNSKLFEPGLQISKMTVVKGGKAVRTVSGKVVYRRLFYSNVQKLFAQVGIKFVGE